MSTVFSVISPVINRSLLTIAELRSAAGVTDGSKDDVLADIGLQVSDLICSACNVASDGVNIPTLLAETVSDDVFYSSNPSPELVLSRRFVSSVTSVTEDGISLASSRYRRKGAEGILERIDDSGEHLQQWKRSRIVVTYVAGFASIPADLKLAASRFVQYRMSELGRDPLARSIDIFEVQRTDYWVNTSTSTSSFPKTNGLPPDVFASLSRYMSYPS